MVNFGAVPANSVLPIFFDSYAGSTGASATISGLAVTDIEIYKGTSMTQRSSDAGYTLLDTDGIDLDGITGINGFSIDLGDNTDAGFYAAGSFYTVVVSAITVDSQTVNFVAATFRIVAAENTAGTPVADTVRVGGGSVPSGAIPNAVAGASGGLLISGSNTGTTTLGALTVSGATTLSGAVSLGSTLGVTGTTTFAAINTGAIGTGNVTITGTLSTSGTTTLNALTVTNALTTGSITNNGTTTLTGATTFTGTVGMSNGLNVIGGTNTNAVVFSAAAGGHGLLTQGNTTGHGINAIGGSTGIGVRMQGGSTSGAGLALVNTSGSTLTSSGLVTLDSVTVTNATTFTGAVAATNASNDIRGVLLSGTQTFNLTGNITGNLSGSVGSVTGAVGSVTGAVGSVTGNVGGNVVGSTGSVVAAVAITSNIKVNQALAGFEFLMTDNVNHAPATGLTVTVTRSIDGGAFGAGTLSAVTEISDGIYAVDFGAGDLNGKVVTLQASAAGADVTFERIVTQA